LEVRFLANPIAWAKFRSWRGRGKAGSISSPKTCRSQVLRDKIFERVERDRSWPSADLDAVVSTRPLIAHCSHSRRTVEVR
jgi:hypothetical protein